MIILLAYLAKLWALAHRPISAAVDRLPSAGLHAARVSGGLPTALVTVVVPLLRPALLAAWGVCFLTAVHEVTMSSLLYGPGSETLAVVVLNSADLGGVGDGRALYSSRPSWCCRQRHCGPWVGPVFVAQRLSRRLVGIAAVSNVLELRDLSIAYGSTPVLNSAESDGRGGRGRRAARTIRLRQVDSAQRGRRLPADQQRRILLAGRNAPRC